MSELKKKSIDNRVVLVQYICAFTVIMIHSINVKAWGLTAPQDSLSINIQTFLSAVWLFAVPAFFFISGYFMFLRFEPKRYFEIVKKRFFSLEVPFVVWNLIFYILFLLISNIPLLSSKMNRKPLPVSPVYFLKETFLGEGFAPLWYLQRLFLYAVISIVIFYVLKNKYVGFAVIAGLVVFNCLEIKHISFVEWLPMFMSGAFFGMHIKKYEFTGERKGLKITLSAAIVISLLLLSVFLKSDVLRYFYRITSGVLVPVILITLIKKELSLKPIFTISLFIYCTHGFILQILQKLYLIALGAGNLSSLICYFTSPVVTLAIITVIAVFMRRFTPKIWKFLNGGRA